MISQAAVMSRPRSLRVKLDGFLPKARPLEFESGLVVQISGVSPEINETALPSAKAPRKAAQSAVTAGPLAHEQATMHGIADALQSRGSANNWWLCNRFHADGPCDSQQTERVEGSENRRDLALLHKGLYGDCDAR